MQAMQLRRLERLILEVTRQQFIHMNHIEERIMAAVQDATSRLEASTAALLATVTQELSDATTEISQLADAVANGDTTGVADRLNAVSDSLDALNTKAAAGAAALEGDDPKAAPPVDPNPPAGSGQAGG